eukprot:TRINITY_DN2757_c0_g1_i1.p1 TRINITY_DN2757_c0_g1~~TRINITY_DN2757_c0_g1_i1.p1  ORF type:complete len:443 (+),score=125.88 TRINITY_DN2757_c0_g1_i1:10-1338(+)
MSLDVVDFASCFADQAAMAEGSSIGEAAGDDEQGKKDDVKPEKGTDQQGGYETPAMEQHIVVAAASEPPVAATPSEPPAAATPSEPPAAAMPSEPPQAPSTSSSQPKTQNEYVQFREQLRHPSAAPLIAHLQDFVQRFPSGLAREAAASRIHKFLSALQDRMLTEVAVFKEADEDGQTNAAEGLEKFLLSRLHPKIFAVEKADLSEDTLLRQRIDSLSWVSFSNLGVPPVETSLLALAVEQLQGIDKFKAPRDKIICILNTCRVINDVLKRAIVESGSAGRPLSADDFLPLLIFVVIMANPPRIQSNLEYVAAFRHPSRLIAEDAYFLTSLQSAVAFVKDAGHKALDVSEEDFSRLCQESLAAKASVSQTATAAAKGQELSAEVRQLLSERLAALPMRFEGVMSVRNLRVGDVPSLLEEYQAMAKLLREVQNETLRADVNTG